MLNTKKNNLNINDNFINVVLDEPFNIKAYKINVSGLTGQATIKYRGNCGNQQLNRSNDNLFATKEEAQARCNELNRERRHITLDSIIIQDSFRNNKPSIEKITERLNYYKNQGKFEKEITVNKDNVLLDGYITYLICKMLDKNYVNVVVDEIPQIEEDSLEDDWN
jgi:hypothetical protein